MRKPAYMQGRRSEKTHNFIYELQQCEEFWIFVVKSLPKQYSKGNVGRGPVKGSEAERVTYGEEQRIRTSTGLSDTRLKHFCSPKARPKSTAMEWISPGSDRLSWCCPLGDQSNDKEGAQTVGCGCWQFTLGSIRCRGVGGWLALPPASTVCGCKGWHYWKVLLPELLQTQQDRGRPGVLYGTIEMLNIICH